MCKAKITSFNECHLLVLISLLLFSIQVDAVPKKPQGWLGVAVREMTPSLRDEYELGDRFGLIVTEVIHDSPADEAGLREDDVILEFNGKGVDKAEPFSEMVRATAPGTKVNLLISRAGQEREMEVAVEKRRTREYRPFHWSGNRFEIFGNRPRLGVEVHELNRDLAAYFKVEPSSGVLISEVVNDSPAEKAGLKAGDILTKIEDEKVTGPEELMEILSDYDEGDKVNVEYVRKGRTETAEIELEEENLHDIRIGRWPGLRMHRLDRNSVCPPNVIISDFHRRDSI